eukprot:TRINITY_DN6011_c1_g1_i1.p1 TRINITY_DN6011_c1_g1~~TRINITY_DN6011_c1_g1_i1.p1  ORF type:complete len:2484 (+),score=651.35 TRINITY_DN6011_c1_g1_i1:91-7452(+)
MPAAEQNKAQGQLACLDEEALKDITAPINLNSGALQDIYQLNTTDFDDPETLEVTYEDGKGGWTSEIVFVDPIFADKRPRICVSVEGIQAMHAAISVLIRKVDNLVTTQKNARTAYLKELTGLRENLQQQTAAADAGKRYSAPSTQLYDPSTFNQLLKEEQEEAVKLKTKDLNDKLLNSEMENMRLQKRLKILNLDLERTEGAVKKSVRDLCSDLLAMVNLDALLRSLSTAASDNEAAFTDAVEDFLGERKGIKVKELAHTHEQDVKKIDSLEVELLKLKQSFVTQQDMHEETSKGLAEANAKLAEANAKLRDVEEARADAYHARDEALERALAADKEPQKLREQLEQLQQQHSKEVEELKLALENAKEHKEDDESQFKESQRTVEWVTWFFGEFSQQDQASIICNGLRALHVDEQANTAPKLMQAVEEHVRPKCLEALLAFDHTTLGSGSQRLQHIESLLKQLTKEEQIQSAALLPVICCKQAAIRELEGIPRDFADEEQSSQQSVGQGGILDLETDLSKGCKRALMDRLVRKMQPSEVQTLIDGMGQKAKKAVTVSLFEDQDPSELQLAAELIYAERSIKAFAKGLRESAVETMLLEASKRIDRQSAIEIVTTGKPVSKSGAAEEEKPQKVAEKDVKSVQTDLSSVAKELIHAPLKTDLDAQEQSSFFLTTENDTEDILRGIQRSLSGIATEEQFTQTADALGESVSVQTESMAGDAGRNVAAGGGRWHEVFLRLHGALAKQGEKDEQKQEVQREEPEANGHGGTAALAADLEAKAGELAAQLEAVQAKVASQKVELDELREAKRQLQHHLEVKTERDHAKVEHLQKQLELAKDFSKRHNEEVEDLRRQSLVLHDEVELARAATRDNEILAEAQVDQLRAEKARLEKQVASMGRKIASMKELQEQTRARGAAEGEAQVAQVQDELSQLRLQHELLEQELQEDRKSAYEIELEANQIQAENKKLQNEIEAMTRTASRLDALLASERNKSQALENALTDEGEGLDLHKQLDGMQKDRIRSLEEEVDDVRAAKESLAKSLGDELDESRLESRKLFRENKQLSRKLALYSKEFEARETSGAKNAEFSALQQEELRMDNEHLTEEVDALETEAKALRAENRQLKLDLEALRKIASPLEVESPAPEKNGSKLASAGRNESKPGSASRKDSKPGSAGGKESKPGSAGGKEAAASKKPGSKISGRSGSKEADTGQAESAAAAAATAAQGPHATQMPASGHNLWPDIAEKDSEAGLAAALREVQEVHARNKQLMKELSELREELKNAQSSVDPESPRSTLTKQEDTTDKEVQEVHARNKQLMKELSELRDKLKNAQSSVDPESPRSTLTKQEDTTDKEVQEVHARNKQLMKELSELRDKLKNAQSSVDPESPRSTLTKQEDTTDKEVQELHARKKQLKKEVRELREELRNAKASGDQEVAPTISSSKEETTDMEAEVQKVRAQNRQLKKELEQLREELRTMTLSVDSQSPLATSSGKGEAKDNEAEVRAQNRQLKKELEQLREELRKMTLLVDSESPLATSSGKGDAKDNEAEVQKLRAQNNLLKKELEEQRNTQSQLKPEPASVVSSIEEKPAQLANKRTANGESEAVDKLLDEEPPPHKQAASTAPAAGRAASTGPAAGHQQTRRAASKEPRQPSGSAGYPGFAESAASASLAAVEAHESGAARGARMRASGHNIWSDLPASASGHTESTDVDGKDRILVGIGGDGPRDVQHLSKDELSILVAKWLDDNTGQPDAKAKASEADATSQSLKEYMDSVAMYLSARMSGEPLEQFSHAALKDAVHDFRAIGQHDRLVERNSRRQSIAGRIPSPGLELHRINPSASPTREVEFPAVRQGLLDQKLYADNSPPGLTPATSLGSLVPAGMLASASQQSLQEYSQQVALHQDMSQQRPSPVQERLRQQPVPQGQMQFAAHPHAGGQLHCGGDGHARGHDRPEQHFGKDVPGHQAPGQQGHPPDLHPVLPLAAGDRQHHKEGTLVSGLYHRPGDYLTADSAKPRTPRDLRIDQGGGLTIGKALRASHPGRTQQGSSRRPAPTSLGALLKEDAEISNPRGLPGVKATPRDPTKLSSVDTLIYPGVRSQHAEPPVEPRGLPAVKITPRDQRLSGSDLVVGHRSVVDRRRLVQGLEQVREARRPLPGRTGTTVHLPENTLFVGRPGSDSGDLRTSDDEEHRGRKTVRRKIQPHQKRQAPSQRTLVEDLAISLGLTGRQGSKERLASRSPSEQRVPAKSDASPSMPPILVSLASGEELPQRLAQLRNEPIAGAANFVGGLQAKSIPLPEKAQLSNVKPKKADDRRLDGLLGDVALSMDGQPDGAAMPNLKHNARASNRRRMSSSSPGRRGSKSPHEQPSLPRTMELTGLGARSPRRHSSKEAPNSKEQVPPVSKRAAGRGGAQTARERRSSGTEERYRPEDRIVVSKIRGSGTNLDARSILEGDRNHSRS